jgi:hypothetical protein
VCTRWLSLRHHLPAYVRGQVSNGPLSSWEAELCSKRREVTLIHVEP